MDDHRPQKTKSHNQNDDLSKQGPYQEFDEDVIGHGLMLLLSIAKWRDLLNS
jgi:hypothetical protein